MKKIISITLGGRTVAIEETAYHEIKNYIESLRQYYRNEEGRDEIIADIESRFSELMYEKLQKGAAHITDADVDEMIAAMGRPEDFDKDFSDSGAAKHSDFNFQKRRLYRDENNKIIGGVCSGIANWLNVDPTVVRVLFTIISFGGLGSGFVIYILLWILLPAKNMSVYNGKRMFRNPDDKIIGGVAGGMGAYFNISATTVRWIFAAPLILNVLRNINIFRWSGGIPFFPFLIFGGITSTFIFIYIVLWIILPEAKTPFQKMEMYGKTIDVNTIKENVQNSMNDLKDRMQNWSEEVKQTGQRISHQAKTFTQNHRGGAAYVIGTVFKVFFLFIAAAIVMPFFIAFIAILFGAFAWAPVTDFLWSSDEQQTLAWGTFLFFIGAPIVGLTVGLIRKIFSIKTPGNYLNWLFGGLWTIGWVFAILFAVSISNDLKEHEKTETPVTIQQPTNGKMIVFVNGTELEFHGRNNYIQDFSIKGVSLNKDTLKLSTVGVRIEKSPDSLYHVLLTKKAMGRTEKEALERIDKMQYDIISTDSILNLPNGFSIDKNSKYRFQQVQVLIQVPAGKKIKIDPSVRGKFNAISAGINYSSFSKNRYKFNALFFGMDYTMNSDGHLISENDTTSPPHSDDENYHWKENDSSKETTKTSADTQTNVYRFNARKTNE
jgi:phage shock protein PspC (stress-responsive transcriptional regulator)